jgi:hypothetical protein
MVWLDRVRAHPVLSGALRWEKWANVLCIDVRFCATRLRHGFVLILILKGGYSVPVLEASLIGCLRFLELCAGRILTFHHW